MGYHLHRTSCRRLIGIVFTLLFFCWGCSVLSPNTQNTSGSSKKDKQKQASHLYYDFDDVLIPKELKLDRDSSFVFESTGVTAGVLVLDARVDLNSLIDFFEINMRKDNWRLISSFKSERTLLLFHKENRWCVINITDTTMSYNTRVEIWVAPASDAAEGSLLK